MNWTIRILNTPEEMVAVEDLQRLVWTGSELEIVPAHILLAAIHNGGLAIGAYPISNFNTESTPPLIGFVFGFPGLTFMAGKPKPKHQSHMLATHPDYRDKGLGFMLKRAQWQMVRHQGLDLICWTYDPLLSLNANLNIAKLGAVCNTYLPNEYGEMRDGLNAGLPSDRFQVDWWVNTSRVERRLSRRARTTLDLAHYLEAGIQIINRSQMDAKNLPQPTLSVNLESVKDSILLVEIPANYQSLKADDFSLALEWRYHTRAIFEHFFHQGYLITDFVYLGGEEPRGFYVVSYGKQTLDGSEKEIYENYAG
ncbi:MAG: hypothetical protein WCI88_13055 [Chloroflexota bacterium]